MRRAVPGGRDAFWFVGLALLAWGLWHVYEPLPFIVIGALFVYMALYHGYVVARIAPAPIQKERR